MDVVVVVGTKLVIVGVVVIRDGVTFVVVETDVDEAGNVIASVSIGNTISAAVEVTVEVNSVVESDIDELKGASVVSSSSLSLHLSSRLNEICTVLFDRSTRST